MMFAQMNSYLDELKEIEYIFSKNYCAQKKIHILYACLGCKLSAYYPVIHVTFNC